MGSSTTGRGNYRHVVILMDIGTGNKTDCIHIREPKGGQNQLMHIISSYGYNLISTEFDLQYW